MSLRSLLVPAGALLVALAFTGCPANEREPETDGGSVGTDGGGADGGAIDAGPQKCTKDEMCAATEYCVVATGECVEARACANNDACWNFDLSVDDYCAFGACFCDDKRGEGRCRPRFKPCAACTRDLECGDDGFVYTDYVAKCVEFQGTKVCLPQRPVCPPGYRAGADNNCEPGSGSCGDASVCTKDEDCDARGEKPVCDKTRGFCIGSCLFDFTTGQSNCPTDQRCHVDPRLLVDGNPNFGGGKCGPQCEGEGAFTCPAGTACVPDGDPRFAIPQPKRCRPAPPKCVRDQDCPADVEGHSRGFCDQAALTCKGGCRREADCESGYACLQNVCQKKTCIEGGGAIFACTNTQFCCGEESSPECAAGVPRGDCYEAPKPPWCQTCTEAGKQSDPPGDMARPGKSTCFEIAEGKKFVLHRCEKGKGVMCPGGRNCERIGTGCDEDGQCGPGGKCIVPDPAKPDEKTCGCENGATCPEEFLCDTRNYAGTQRQVCAAYFCATPFCAQAP